MEYRLFIILEEQVKPRDYIQIYKGIWKHPDAFETLPCRIYKGL